MSIAATRSARNPGRAREIEKAFPLRPIRSEQEYEIAGRILNRLMGRERPLSGDERDYMEDWR